MINIATGDSRIVSQIIERVNKTYNTEFKLVGTEDKGGVEFAIVEIGEATQDEIFLLGYYYGAKVRELRDEKKIDW